MVRILRAKAIRGSVQQVLQPHRARPVTLAYRRYSSADANSIGGLENPFTYCRNFVRQHDRDSYLTSQFFPKNLQGFCFAVRAFYIELAMIQDSISNVVIGEMRMQFWKDAVKNISEGRPPRHPIALALHEASKNVHIAPYHLRRIVEAREAELRSPSHLSMETLLAHAEATSSTLNYVLLSILGASSSETYSHAASHLGVTQTLTTLLRALPYHASKGHMVIPASITAKHHVNQDEVFRRGPETAGIEDAVYEFAVVANDHLLTARSVFKNEKDDKIRVPREAMPVFLGAVPSSNFLKRLEESNFNAFDPKLQIRDSLRLPWQIWSSNFESTF